MRFNKGFTLIELLVVIAIIGILASIILISVGGARAKGGDANVQANLKTLQTQLEYLYDSSVAGYGTPIASGACPSTGSYWSDPTVMAAINSIKSNGGGAALCAVGVSGASYAVAGQLKSNTAQYWCVDSTGNSKLEASAPALAGNTVAAACP